MEKAPGARGKAILPALRKTLVHIKFLGRTIDRKGRLLLMNGLLMSRIIYTLPIYGGIHDIHAQKIQTLMNNEVRFICSKGRRTLMQELMVDCNWMSFRELVRYHLMLLLWKIIRLKKPDVMSDKLQLDKDDFILGRIHGIVLHVVIGMRCPGCREKKGV